MKLSDTFYCQKKGIFNTIYETKHCVVYNIYRSFFFYNDSQYSKNNTIFYLNNVHKKKKKL